MGMSDCIGVHDGGLSYLPSPCSERFLLIASGLNLLIRVDQREGWGEIVCECCSGSGKHYAAPELCIACNGNGTWAVRDNRIYEYPGGREVIAMKVECATEGESNG